jgi:hypothetical protein
LLQRAKDKGAEAQRDFDVTQNRVDLLRSVIGNARAVLAGIERTPGGFAKTRRFGPERSAGDLSSVGQPILGSRDERKRDRERHAANLVAGG